MKAISYVAYKTTNPSGLVLFKHPGHESVHTQLKGRVAYLCKQLRKTCVCTRGMVTKAEQTAIRDAYLKKSGYVMSESGAVYRNGQCYVAAPGTSPHEFGHAMDITDSWFKALSNDALLDYGLIKPMAHEPWHVQLIETKGTAVKTFKPVYDLQHLVGETVDGIAGTRTRYAAYELIDLALKVLGVPEYDDATDIVNDVAASPEHWLNQLENVPFLAELLEKINARLRGI